jgi:2-keto-4-pentenoate hydratase/2-oxohepta-3-ene-1,7-dioic acid hydratase in catechol pathway
MKLVRFRTGPEAHPRYGRVEGDVVVPIAGGLTGPYDPAGDALPLNRVTLLAPVQPRQILAVALNYQSHLGERSPSEKPELFWKAPSSVVGPGHPIVLPAASERVDYEGELVAVIGRTCRKVSREAALDYVLGYTCGNDVSARDWQRGDQQWWRAKSADTFSPLGPWIVDGLDPAALHLTTRVNGRVVQDTPTRLMIHDVAAVVSFASQFVTLEPGDLIFTGTSGQTQPLHPGDVVEVEVDAVGVLQNPVVAEEAD